ncbi:MAG: cell division protein FtsA [Chloroflexi bacterium]|nr:cell division protein FtsA [Chloroflexota bacterium]
MMLHHHKENIRAAIDIGTTKICTVVADVSSGEIRILGTGIAHSEGMHKGQVVDMNKVKESIRESVKIASTSSGHKISSACVGVTGSHINSFNNHQLIEVTRGDHLVCQDDLRKIIESAQNTDMPDDKQLLHIIPRSYSLDGHHGMKNPVGLYGQKLDLETHIITASVAAVKNLVKCVKMAGVDVDGLVVNSLASAEAVLTEHEKELGVIIADIGGGTTDVAMYKDNGICYTSVLPVSGYQITRDISISLGLPINIAEEAKKKYADLTEDLTRDAKESLALSVENGYKVIKQDLYEVVRARTEEIIKLVMMAVPKADFNTWVPMGLVITGGTAVMPGLEKAVRDMYKIPVRIGSPRELQGVTDALHAPAYATSVGLLLWSLKMDRDQMVGGDEHDTILDKINSKWHSIFMRDREEETAIEMKMKGGNHGERYSR